MNSNPLFDSTPEPTSKNSLRILVAEDDLNIRDLLYLILTQAGYLVSTASDGLCASSAIASDAFDLVITDHEMPRLNGLGLVKQLRSVNYPGKIIVLSSPPSMADRGAYKGLSVDRMLSKPCLNELLIQTIEEVTH
ncbi:MAG: response regulator receiver protein [Chthoniobacteraceae bacterium]|nr:response regulator receiver protein [Chthoniobacteraceae bacterium]